MCFALPNEDEVNQSISISFVGQLELITRKAHDTSYLLIQMLDCPSHTIHTIPNHTFAAVPWVPWVPVAVVTTMVVTGGLKTRKGIMKQSSVESPGQLNGRVANLPVLVHSKSAVSCSDLSCSSIPDRIRGWG